MAWQQRDDVLWSALPDRAGSGAGLAQLEAGRVVSAIVVFFPITLPLLTPQPHFHWHQQAKHALPQLTVERYYASSSVLGLAQVSSPGMHQTDPGVPSSMSVFVGHILHTSTTPRLLVQSTQYDHRPQQVLRIASSWSQEMVSSRREDGHRCCIINTQPKSRSSGAALANDEMDV
ncbi:hypothetical protein CVT26_003280 [Gymnopilus dilepis]|uniref:Uncharacterized protein n=1 Tax=Gymnopilus dilepis TaxID=231916 RepID=A0A409Y545_9AGAR|nr:hypothetical protein CVT26_003280 [Gymnopilus dilepis]